MTLSAGQTASCKSLVTNQLYAVLLYNTSPTVIDAAVTVVWSNDVPPSRVVVRGTTAEAAAANFVFVSGTDTGFVSISLEPGTGATVAALVVSVSMPWNTAGLNNAELPSDGQFHPYQKYYRYYTKGVPGWRSVTIESPVTQFISLRIIESAATVIVVNVGSGLADGQVSKFGPTANQADTVQIKNVQYQSYLEYIQGNGGIWVWMYGDSQLNSASARIALQGLSATALFLKLSGLSRLSEMIRSAVRR